MHFIVALLAFTLVRVKLLESASLVTMTSFDGMPWATAVLVRIQREGYTEEAANTIDFSNVGFGFRLPIITFNFNQSTVEDLGRPADSYFFDKMYIEDNIIFPKYLGPIKFSVQRQLIVVHNHHVNPAVLEALTRTLVWTQLSRPDEDHFVFYGSPTSLRQTPLLREIRNKYYIEGCCNSSLFFYDKYNIVGSHLRVSSVRGTPWLQLDADSSGKPLKGGEIRGVNYRLIRESAAKYNFTFSIQYANSGGSSGFKRDGKWFGVVGEVYHRQADIGWGTGITSFRHLVVDHSTSLEELQRIFFIRAPSSARTWRAILSPLQPSIWLMTLVTAFLLIPSCYWSLRSEYVFRKFAIPRYLGRIVFQAILSIWLEQSFTSRIWSGARLRLLLFLWMFFSLVITSGYRSRLVYFLTFNFPRQVPLTHGALIAENYHLLFRYYGGVAYNYAVLSKDPMQHEIIRRALLINSSQECISAAVRSDRVACLDWDVHGSYAVATNATVEERQTYSLIIKSKDAVVSGQQIAWSFRKGSPMKGIFNSYIGQLWASGILRRWNTQDWADSKRRAALWVKSNPNVGSNREGLEFYAELTSSSNVLQMRSFYGVFVFLGICLVLAGATCGLEGGLKILQIYG